MDEARQKFMQARKAQDNLHYQPPQPDADEFDWNSAEGRAALRERSRVAPDPQLVPIDEEPPAPRDAAVAPRTLRCTLVCPRAIQLMQDPASHSEDCRCTQSNGPSRRRRQRERPGRGERRNQERRSFGRCVGPRLDAVQHS